MSSTKIHQVTDKLATPSKSESQISLTPTAGATICPLLNEHAFDCPVCLDLLCEPVTLSCGHTYCEHCISQWIASHTSSRSRNRGKCCCPSCKALIHNKFEPQSISYTLREFLQKQFSAKYNARYNETHPLRKTWNQRLNKLKKKRDQELKHLSSYCGFYKVKRWILRNVDLMANPDLHDSIYSWLLRWLLVYLIILCISLPYLVPLLTNALNRTTSHRNDNDASNLYFLDDILEYFGVNTVSNNISLWNMAPLIHLCHSVLEYFGVIVPITNTGYLPDNFIMNSAIPYEELGNIYHSDSTDLYYKSLFVHWKSKEFKLFTKRYAIDDTCLEKSCYTDNIVNHLKIFEWETLKEDPLPMSILQEYLQHYDINYDECYISFWNKDYDCVAKKAASTKIVNDVYYNKQYLLSWKAHQRWRDIQFQQSQKQKHNEKENKHKDKKQHQRNTVFDIGHFAFNVLSGLR